MDEELLRFSRGDFCSLMTYGIAHRLEVLQNNILREYGVSHQQTQILAFIYARPNTDVFQKDLEKELGLKSSTVTVILQNLEKKQFIERCECDYDKRQKILRVTKKAVNLHEQFMSSVNAIEFIMTDGMTEKEKETLKKLLRKAVSNVRKYTDGE